MLLHSTIHHHYYYKPESCDCGFYISFLLNLLHMQVDESYNYMDTCGLPNIYTFSPAALGLTLYTRQTTRAHVTTITYNSIK